MPIERREDKYEAAMYRHYQDGVLLQKHLRYDNAMCHFSFAAECGLKYLIKAYNRSDGRLRHQFSDFERVLTQILIENPSAAVWVSLPEIPECIKSGHPVRRYWADGAFSEEDARLAEQYAGQIVQRARGKYLDELSLCGGMGSETS